MPTYIDMLNEGAEEQMASDQALFKCVTDYRRYMLGNVHLREHWIPIFHQARNALALVDWYFLAQIHAAVLGGDIVMCSLPVGCGAPPDARLDGIGEFPAGEGYRVSFQRAPDDDGYFAWDIPLTMQRQIDGAPVPVIEPSGLFPIEVGSTRVQTTWFHLNQGGGVARWPYDMPDLYVIRMRQECLDQRMDARAELFGLVDLIESKT